MRNFRVGAQVTQGVTQHDHRLVRTHRVASAGSLAAIAAFTLVAPASAQADWCVDVSLRFASYKPSRVLLESLESTAAAIWEPYGVRFVWVNSTGMRCDAAQGSFDVLVVHDPEKLHTSTLVVLGSTRVGPPGIDHVPIQLNFGTIERLLEHLPIARIVQATGHTNVSGEDLGRALGRVLAHEVGHVLLSAAAHQPYGLMRPSFDPDDLVRHSGRSFGLSPAEVARLSQRERDIEARRRRGLIATRVATSGSQVPAPMAQASASQPGIH